MLGEAVEGAARAGREDFAEEGGELGLSCQGCRNGRFGKRCFCPPLKTGSLTTIGENSVFASYPRKQGALLLRPMNSKKMTDTRAKNHVFQSTVLTAPMMCQSSC